MVNIKKESDEGKISINGQEIPTKVRYFDIPVSVETTPDEPLLGPRRGKLIIEGDRVFLSNLLHEMQMGQCVLYLKDRRHVDFRVVHGNFDFNNDPALPLVIELSGPVEL